MGTENYASVILDEISLEGLDGITLETLWYRLEDLDTWQLKPIVESIKKFVWEIVVNNNLIMQNIEFYELPEERVLCFEKESMDIDNDKMYPYCLVSEQGIRGSCCTYNTRRNITDDVRGLTLAQVRSRWGNKLAIVARQRARCHSLYSHEMNPEHMITDVMYCMLEKIGRGRAGGESSYNLNKLKCGANPAFYSWNCLKGYGLVVIRLPLKPTFSTSRNNQLYLKRFARSAKMVTSRKLLNEVIDKIRREGGRSLYNEIAEIASAEKMTMKSMLKGTKFKKSIKTQLVPLGEMMPHLPPSELTTKTGNWKMVRVVTLIEQDANDTKKDKYNDGDESDDQSDDESGGYESDDQNDGDPANDQNNVSHDHDQKNVSHGHDQKYEDQSDSDEEIASSSESDAEYRGRCMDRSLSSQCYQYIESCRLDGATQRKIKSRFGLTKLMARHILRLLVTGKHVFMTSQDVGRQRVFIYIASRFQDLLNKEVANLSLDSPSAIENDTSANSPNLASNSRNASEEKLTEASENNGASELACKKRISEIALEEDLTPETKRPKMSFQPTVVGVAREPSIKVRKRAKYLLDFVNSRKIVRGLQLLVKAVRDQEYEEGLPETPCRRSIKKIIDNLKNDNKIKIIEKTMTNEAGKETHFSFICSCDVDPDGPLIGAEIERMKVSISMQEHTKKAPTPKVVKPKPSDEILKISEILESIKLPANATFQKNQARLNGYCPRFLRIRLLHELLFYLLYDYTGKVDLDQEECKRRLRVKEGEALPRVYNIEEDSPDWTVFIPPVMPNTDHGPGWISICDIMTRMPLNVYPSVVNVPYSVPYLQEYKSHPIKKYYLILDLPVEMRNVLMAERRMVMGLNNILKDMCSIGLVQMGERNLKNCLSQYFYLNRNASLLDTRISTPSTRYRCSDKLAYERRDYHFGNAASLKRYWKEAKTIATNTPLGVADNGDDAKQVNRIGLKSQQAAFAVEWIKPVGDEEARKRDKEGFVPGDRLGAAGFDSSIFSHSNKVWNVSNAETWKVIRPMKTSVKSASLVAKKKKTIAKKNSNSKRDKKLNSEKIPKSNTRVRHWHWTEREENCLMLIRAAAKYFCRTQLNYAPHSVSVDILREEVGSHVRDPDYRVKTESAIARKNKLMMKNSDFEYYVNACALEIRSNSEISAKFGNASANMRAKLENKNIEEVRNDIDANVKELYRVLRSLYPDIRKHFSATRKPDKLPDAIKQYEDKLSEYGGTKQINSSMDLEVYVLKEIIMCSLLTQKISANALDWRKFYATCERYSRHAFTLALNSLRRERVVSQMKMSSVNANYEGSVIKMGQSNHHLSITYHLKLKSFYEMSAFGELLSRLKEILSTGILDNNLRSSSAVNIALAHALCHENAQFHVDWKPDERSFAIQNLQKEIAEKRARQEDVGSDGSGSEEEEGDNEDDEKKKVENAKCFGVFTSRILYDGTIKINDNIYDNTFMVRLRNFSATCTLPNEASALSEMDARNKRVLQMERKASKFKCSFNEKLDVSYFRNVLTKVETRLAAEIMDFIKTEEILGASLAELRNRFLRNGDEKSFAKIMRCLEDRELLLVTGEGETVFVHSSYASHWLLTDDSDTLKSTAQRDIDSDDASNSGRRLVHIRPWVKLNGELNEQVFYSMAMRVFGAVLTSPGISLRQLQARFYPSLFYQDAKRLVRVLVELKCVRQTKAKSTPAKSLFSCRDDVVEIEEATGYEEEESIILEAEFDAMIKMASFIEDAAKQKDLLALNKASNKQQESD